MKLTAIIILLSTIVLNSCKKSNQVSGTYVAQSVMLPMYNGCCTATEVLQLNNDHTFTAYHQDDQGDYLTKDFTSGSYDLKQNMISFKPDSLNQHYDYSKVKYKVPPTDDQVNLLIKQDQEPQKFYKIDFKKADSLYIQRYSHTDWDQESITVKKDGVVHYVRHSQDKNGSPVDISKHKKLTQDQFQQYIETLSQNRLFQASTTSEKYSITFSLVFKKDNNMVIHDQNNMDKKLYDFFFETVRNWVQ
ncbi:MULTISPECIES: hypothetical protein [unclassified Chryseobacterium]|uniref:hypothetical protein n=1 Tax=unclassified Chryseobacterium TaxID=2593645 RepID=UPI00100BB636|nr:MULTISPECIES: hypothetical protein [unclassified Chryseobacterium]RXM51678.1 hypothetical protein BOQ64_12210 [Chryseobacterium sp. CH25]RXM67255.1 hypothetical protein BOQ60_04935 [Chryseobacterium sp. CH1]